MQPRLESPCPEQGPPAFWTTITGNGFNHACRKHFGAIQNKMPDQIYFETHAAKTVCESRCALK
jgi:hypothetical protein